MEALGQSIQADVFHLYSLKAGAVYGSVLMNYFVVGAPATEWRISVPEGIGNIDVTGQNVGRDWRREGNTVIVPLSRPVLGTGTLLLTFEQPMSSRGGKLSPGEVRPLGVQGERGFVQVVSPLQVNHKSSSEGALLAIDPSELPAEFRLLSSAPTLGAWQYTARDFKIGMEIEWFEPGETVGQVVDFLKAHQPGFARRPMGDGRADFREIARSQRLAHGVSQGCGVVGGEGRWRGGQRPCRWRRNPGAAARTARSQPSGGGFLALRRPRRKTRPSASGGTETGRADGHRRVDGLRR